MSIKEKIRFILITHYKEVYYILVFIIILILLSTLDMEVR